MSPVSFRLLFPPFTGNNQDLSPPNLPVHSITTTKSTGLSGGPGIGNNNLNINLPENNNAILRLEVELRDKNAPKYRRAAGLGVPSAAAAAGRGGAARPAGYNRADGKGIGGAVTNVMTDLKGNAIIPLEKVGKQNVYHLVSRQNVPHISFRLHEPYRLSPQYPFHGTTICPMFSQRCQIFTVGS